MWIGGDPKIRRSFFLVKQCVYVYTWRCSEGGLNIMLRRLNLNKTFKKVSGSTSVLRLWTKVFVWTKCPLDTSYLYSNAQKCTSKMNNRGENHRLPPEKEKEDALLRVGLWHKSAGVVQFLIALPQKEVPPKATF